MATQAKQAKTEGKNNHDAAEEQAGKDDLVLKYDSKNRKIVFVGCSTVGQTWLNRFLFELLRDYIVCWTHAIVSTVSAFSADVAWGKPCSLSIHYLKFMFIVFYGEVG